MMSDQINELAAALALAQAQIRPAAKDSVNPHFRSKYADLASIWDACREALTANGLSVVQMPTDAEPGTVALRTVLLHTSGQYLFAVVSARLARDDAQGVGSALTYLRRYSLAAMVGVVADEDDDGNAATRPSSAPQAEGAPRPRRPDDSPARAQPPAMARDLAPVKALIDAIRKAGADPGKITPRQMLDLSDQEFNDYVGGLRKMLGDLTADEVPADL